MSTVYVLNHTSHLGDHIYVFATLELAEEQAAKFLAYGFQDFQDKWKLTGQANVHAELAVAKLLELYKAGSYSEMVTEYHDTKEFCDIWVGISPEEVMTETFSPWPKREPSLLEQLRLTPENKARIEAAHKAKLAAMTDEERKAYFESEDARAWEEALENYDGTIGEA